MFIAGIFGIILHSLMTIRKINKSIESETYTSVFKKYWRMDWLSLVTAFIVLCTAVYISSDFLNVDPDKPMPGNLGALLQYKIITYIKTTFLVVGYCADSIVYSFLGSAEQKLKERAKANNVNIDNN